MTTDFFSTISMAPSFDRQLKLAVSLKRGKLSRKFLRLSDRDQMTFSKLCENYPIHDAELDTFERNVSRNFKPIAVTRDNEPWSDGWTFVLCDFTYFSVRVIVTGATVKECVKAFESFRRLLSRPLSIDEWAYIGKWMDENMHEGAYISSAKLISELKALIVNLVLADWNSDGYYGTAYNG